MAAVAAAAAADESIGQLLTKLYYQPGGSAAYSSVNRLYKEARKHNPSVTHKIVNQFLAKQYTHTVHRKINRQFPRRKVLSLRIDETWASDLITVNEVLNPIQSNPIQSNPTQFHSFFTVGIVQQWIPIHFNRNLHFFEKTLDTKIET